MPASRLIRTQVMQRVGDLLALDPGVSEFQIDVGPPHAEWTDTPGYILLARCTGNVDNARFGRPNPTWDDHCDVEIWTQGFASTSFEASEVAERAMTTVLKAISPNRQLALDDPRLDGVQTSHFTELDGPMFLGTDQGVIVSFRTLLHVQTLVRTENE